jgi:transposase InsO family protein
MAYKLIHAEKANFKVTMMCGCMDVSPSGYYAWIGRGPSERAKDNETLSKEIRRVFDESRGTYGSPRVHTELVELGHDVDVKRVARLMAQMGLRARTKPKFRKTTDSDHDLPIAPNKLDRNFEVDEPDRVWVSDITYVWTVEGWMYLAVIIDLFSRRVIGWAIADHMRTELVLDALSAALGSRTPSGKGLLFHSDRGSQYASHAFQDALANAGIECSMSRRGDCWDNAVAESFFSTIKTELIYNLIFTTKASAHSVIAEWIGIFYNAHRRHSSADNLAPAEYERRFYANLNAALAA